MISIIDYGMGNLRSVQKGFEKVGIEAKIITDPDLVLKADGLVLPGVGAFSDAIKNLKNSGMDEAIIKYIALDKPFLGICLGLQLLFESSEEWGHTEGLGVLKGTVKKLSGNLKIPHMGWNYLNYQEDNLKAKETIFKDIPLNTAFYFVHSYYVSPEDKRVIAGTTDYGIDFTVAVVKNNLSAIQFHPEKSSFWGLKLLQNFGGVVDDYLSRH